MITKDSFFYIMQIDSCFLPENPSSWASLDSHQSGLKSIDAWNVVNECAERELKLGADFAPYYIYLFEIQHNGDRVHTHYPVTLISEKKNEDSQKQRFHISRSFSSDTCQGNRQNKEL